MSAARAGQAGAGRNGGSGGAAATLAQVGWRRFAGAGGAPAPRSPLQLARKSLSQAAAPAEAPCARAAGHPIFHPSQTIPFRVRELAGQRLSKSRDCPFLACSPPVLAPALCQAGWQLVTLMWATTGHSTAAAAAAVQRRHRSQPIGARAAGARPLPSKAPAHKQHNHEAITFLGAMHLCGAGWGRGRGRGERGREGCALPAATGGETSCRRPRHQLCGRPSAHPTAQPCPSAPCVGPGSS